MSVHYSQEHGRTVPSYVCRETAVRRAGRACQTVPGKAVDAAVAVLLIEMTTPMTLAVTLEVQRELEARATETDAARRQHVERMRYEAELARRQGLRSLSHERRKTMAGFVTLSGWVAMNLQLV